MRNRLSVFFRCDHGQDVVEYSLMVAFIVLAGAAVLIGMSYNANGLWRSINNRLTSGSLPPSN